jgi:hypothetical protein
MQIVSCLFYSAERGVIKIPRRIEGKQCHRGRGAKSKRRPKGLGITVLSFAKKKDLRFIP